MIVIDGYTCAIFIKLDTRVTCKGRGNC